MHLKSSRGPIDVLVCPETEDSHPPSPGPQQPSDTTTTITTATPDKREVTTTPHKLIGSQQDSNTGAATAAGLMSSDEHDVSLSSIADVAPEELDCLLQYSSGGLDGACLLPSFETLSPPLQEGDFNFGLDVSEGIGDLFDFK